MFGREHIAGVFALTLLVSGVASGAGPPVAGEVADATGSFRLAFPAVALVFLLSAALILVVARMRLQTPEANASGVALLQLHDEERS